LGAKLISVEENEAGGVGAGDDGDHWLALAEVEYLVRDPGLDVDEVAGFVFDRGAQALRPLPGIPGASTVGGPISSGYQLTAAYVAPRLDSAGSSKINKSIGSGSADAEQFFVIQGVDGIAVFRVVAVEVGVAGRPMLHPTENGGHFGGR